MNVLVSFGLNVSDVGSSVTLANAPGFSVIAADWLMPLLVTRSPSGYAPATVPAFNRIVSASIVVNVPTWALLTDQMRVLLGMALPNAS